ncbi:MAG: hypothetical protein ACFFCI_08500 [Promethearchaeota archaeon]
MVTPDLKGVIYVPLKERIELEPSEEVKRDLVSLDSPDPKEKKRVLKRWKQTFGYYSLNPEKFKFGLKDL